MSFVGSDVPHTARLRGRILHARFRRARLPRHGRDSEVHPPEADTPPAASLPSRGRWAMLVVRVGLVAVGRHRLSDAPNNELSGGGLNPDKVFCAALSRTLTEPEGFFPCQGKEDPSCRPRELLSDECPSHGGHLNSKITPAGNLFLLGSCPPAKETLQH